MLCVTLFTFLVLQPFTKHKDDRIRDAATACLVAIEESTLAFVATYKRPVSRVNDVSNSAALDVPPSNQVPPTSETASELDILTVPALVSELQSSRAEVAALQAQGLQCLTEVKQMRIELKQVNKTCAQLLLLSQGGNTRIMVCEKEN